MKVAIHQPNFLPWTGYFLKMAACDIFVFHDNVQITKSGPTRRVKIVSHNHLDSGQWLTVPLKKHSDFARIWELEISEAMDWRKKHLNMIGTVYQKYPFFDQMYPKIKLWYQQSEIFTNLSEMNIFFIKKIAFELGVKAFFFKSSEIAVEGKGSDYNLKIVMHCNGTTYLSGKGAQNYQNNYHFIEQGINLDFIEGKTFLQKQFSESVLEVEDSVIGLWAKEGLENLKMNIRI